MRTTDDRRRRCVGFAAVCAVVAATAALAGDPPAAGPAAASAPVILMSADDLRKELTGLRGEVVILNLWATWCVSCLREIPELVELESEFHSRGVRLLGMAMDEPKDLNALVRPFHAKYFPAFHTGLRGESDMDTMASVVDPAWNEVLPTTYIIDARGEVIKRLQGRQNREAFRARLVQALDRRDAQ
jgi:thiol-disulfide isomerase/thioredoxin